MQNEEEEQEEEERTQKAHNSNKTAYLFATLSSVTMVLMQITLKYMSKHITPTLILGLRGSLLFLYNLILIYFNGVNLHIPDPISTSSAIQVFGLATKRSIFSALTMTLYLGSIKYVPIGIANAFFNTSPIMAFFIEAIYYKKKIFSNLLNLVTILVSFFGVLLIIQPPFLFGSGEIPDHYVFYFVLLFSAFTSSLSFIYLHNLRKQVNGLVALQHGYFFHAIVSYFLYTFTKPQDDKTIQYIRSCSAPQIFKLAGCLILLVIFAFTTQYSLTRAMYLCSPALIMPFSYLSVIFGFIIDVLVFEAKYNGLMVLGMIMASFGVFSKFIDLYFDRKSPQKNEEYSGKQ